MMIRPLVVSDPQPPRNPKPRVVARAVPDNFLIYKREPSRNTKPGLSSPHALIKGLFEQRQSLCQHK